MKRTIIRLVVIIFLICLVIWMIAGRKRIEKNGIYTVGQVTKVERGARTGKSIFYKYRYKGKIYEEVQSANSDTETNTVGEHFIVQFLKDDPESSLLLLNEPTFITIDLVSEDGYTMIPTSVMTTKDSVTFVY